MALVSTTEDFGKVAVMMGGVSPEREISLQSGQAVYDSLKKQGIDATVVDPKKDFSVQLQTGNFDRVFIMLHGNGGEDGLVQGMLEMIAVPYTGSGVLASALAMDKCFSKRIWGSHQLPTPKFIELSASSDWRMIIDYLGLPLIVKPVNGGSSYGISKVRHLGQVENAWHQACQYDQKVIAESWVAGDEYTVPILDNEALPSIRLETPREFYDYEAKYVSDTTCYHCPSGLSADAEDTLGELALNAFNAISASGWGRVDIMIDSVGDPWLIELNTVPGMTSHSLVPMSAKQDGISFDELVLRILMTSFSD